MNNFPISTSDCSARVSRPRRPPGTAGLQTVPGLETFGRRSGKVRRPCHNPVRDREEVGKLFPSCSLDPLVVNKDSRPLFSRDQYPSALMTSPPFRVERALKMGICPGNMP